MLCRGGVTRLRAPRRSALLRSAPHAPRSAARSAAAPEAPAPLPPRARRLAAKRALRLASRPPPPVAEESEERAPLLALLHGAAEEGGGSLGDATAAAAAAAAPPTPQPPRPPPPPPLPYAVHPRLLCDHPGLTLDALKAETELRRELVSTAQGWLPENRLTAWHSDGGDSFTYSGKTMRSAGPLPPLLASVRDSLEASFGVRYDAVLLNLYGDGSSGMRWHSDPQGDDWAPETAVVSVGGARRFLFRQAADPAQQRATFVLHHGSVLRMWGDCQARFQHAVPTEAAGGGRAVGERASLVFKRRNSAAAAAAAAAK